MEFAPYKNNPAMKNLTKRLIAWVTLVALLLLIPLVLTIRDGGVEGVGWNWTLFDFVSMGTLLFGAGVAYELVSRKMRANAYRAAVALAIVTAVLLVWINGAVGIIGDGPVNSLYFGVLLVGIVGALLARFQPSGMARALIAMAFAQASVPVMALVIWKPDFSPGVLRVFCLNAVFVMLFAGSALLFRRASITSTTQHERLV